LDLDALLIAAAEAPPDSRINLRDRIAGHGEAAIECLMEPPWIGDPKYAAFAIRTIAKAGELGARSAAVMALQRALAIVTDDLHRKDVETALALLGGSKHRKPATSKKAKSPHVIAPIAPEDLVVGRCYKRSDLHDGGLGGNRQKGISYPADGTHCLLFSDQSKVNEYGYRDQPVGDDGYRYFGEWSGTGDMSMSGGNQVIADRTPELYLFTTAACGRVFQGQYRLVSSSEEAATRDGRHFRAIVFTLERVP
jgi:hypothetical protein